MTTFAKQEPQCSPEKVYESAEKFTRSKRFCYYLSSGAFFVITLISNQIGIRKKFSRRYNFIIKIQTKKVMSVIRSIEKNTKIVCIVN